LSRFGTSQDLLKMSIKYKNNKYHFFKRKYYTLQTIL
jgi:hypothetical protein